MDEDADGYMWCEDCDDNNPAVHSGAPGICGNGIDDNCDGSPRLGVYRVARDPVARIDTLPARVDCARRVAVVIPAVRTIAHVAAAAVGRSPRP